IAAVDPSTFAADPRAQSCAPGTHTATWQVTVGSGSSSLSVPVAVDASASGTTFPACVEHLYGLGLKLDWFVFDLNRVVRNPTRADVYEFAARGIPRTADGLADPTGAFESRSDAPLPQQVEALATYDPSTRKLVVEGSAEAAGRPND